MLALCGLEFGHGAIPNETTILNIRRLLERLNPTNADVRGPNIGLLKRRVLNARPRLDQSQSRIQGSMSRGFLKQLWT
jgi:hypothetical protein